ncbi:GntR family transcriptional regulator [Nonomuraea basaltis]|uniref:GntR family transcriptional regulator n=1 Tax=Nonomuraea basaltis TaxID=2495887 RepID=UPI00110C70CB|nr:GntR family transcriptional regulator [Nonomuraea basaltis]TMR99486.1 GntR family transcriptional regulator [Nonomuraea basaltis]
MPIPPAKAQAIADELAEAIRRGDYPPGSWLPSERDLSRAHQADRSTIRNAIALVADQGLVTRRPRQGVQVSDPGAQHARIASGREPATLSTTVDETHADAETAHRLGVPAATLLLRRTRVQGVAGDPPVQMSVTYLPREVVELVPSLTEVDTGPGGIYARLEEAGRPVATFEEAVTCRLPNSVEQAALAIGAAEPVLTIWRRSYDRRGRIIDVTHLVVVGSRRERIYRYDPA